MLFFILKIGDLNASQEATKLDLKAAHFEHVQDVKRQYEDSLEGEPCRALNRWSSDINLLL